MILLMELFPSILAKESLEAREIMTRVFIRYFKEGSHNNGSALIRARYDHSMDHNIPIEDIARFEVGGAVGILTNTTPASFWMVYHLYSNPAALEDCRQEISNVIWNEGSTTENGKTVKVLDMSQLKASCPILLSTLQEVLRLHTIGISTRMVMEDHMLDNKYLLRKGSTVMIPGPVQHTSAMAWGSNVDAFEHRRFLPKEKRHNPIAFRGFGGGTTLCPGRHFASTEILAFVAMLIMHFEVTPCHGRWVHLTTDKAGLWETMPVPDDDIEVDVSARDGVNMDSRWRILVSDSDKAMPLSAEDM